MSEQIVSRISDGLAGNRFGGGFRRLSLEASQAARVERAGVGVGVWVAATPEKAAVIRLGSNGQVSTVHVQFPLTASIPDEIRPQSLAGVLALATFLPESGFAIDPAQRICWNVFRDFEASDTAGAAAFLKQCVGRRDNLDPRFFAELRNLGFSTDLSNESDLLGGAAVRLPAEDVERLTQGSKLRSFIVGLALGAGSVVIAGATGGVGTVVGVVGEAAYGSILS